MPPTFFIDWQQMTSFCVTISSRLGSLYAIMTKISTFFYLPFFMTEFLLLCLIQIRDEPIRYIRTRYIFLNNVENLESYLYSKSFTFLCCTIFTKDSLEIWEILAKLKKSKTCAVRLRGHEWSQKSNYLIYKWHFLGKYDFFYQNNR